MRNISIRQKLFVAVMGTATLALLLACSAFIAHGISKEREALATRVGTTAEIVGIHSSAALEFSDQDAAEETLAALGAEKDVLSACLFDASGAAFAGFSQQQPANAIENCNRPLASSDQHRYVDDRFELVHWIQGEVGPLGAIQIRWDPSEIRERTQSSLLIALAVLALTVALALAISSRLQHFVTEPLAELVGGSEALAGGNLSVQVEARAQDEIGVLARSFNAMAGSLRGLISQVRENTLAVATVSEKLRSTGEDLAEESQRQESVVEDAVGAVSEVIDSIGSVSEHVSSLDESARSTAASMCEMGASIGEIANHMDDLAGAIDITSASINQLNVSIHEIAQNMEGLDQATGMAAKLLQDLHTSVARVESNAETCHDLSQNAASEATRGRASVDQTIDAMHEIRDSFGSLKQVIERLAHKSESIGDIMQVIEGVADETNLLSLNAAIIAAQAGEHGRAFSVVASSIKNLAERTAASTREIDALVQSVQQETHKAVESMFENASRVERGVELSNEAGHGLQKIFEGTEQSATMVREIFENSEAQARDLAQVDEAMHQVKQIVEQVNHSIHEHTRASAGIGESSDQIRNLGQQVKYSTEEQSRGAKLVTSAMTEVTGMIERILEATKSQSERSEEVRGALQGFNQVTVENARRAEELRAMVGGLSERSAELEREVGRFKL